MIKVIVCGYMIRFPLAGVMMAYFHYILGLKRLGHDVIYLETSGWPNSCFNTQDSTWGNVPATGLRAVRALFAEHRIEVPAIYVDQEREIALTGRREDVRDALAKADLVLNLGGVNYLPEMDGCRRHALVDMDPFFTQVGRFGHAHLERFTSCFSYGANIGKPGCTIPTLGIHWLPMAPPVVPDLWELPPPGPGAQFSTVASWSAYGETEYAGARYGQKDREFLRFVGLPQRMRQPFDLALTGAPGDVRTLLERNGWRLKDAVSEVTCGLAGYRDYIRASRGEFSVAKHAYVATRSGWFSDRTACYLAAGRPAVLQDTGFSDWLPSGTGVVPFTTIDEAADGIEQVTAEYRRHAAAAQALVQDFFSHTVVLPRLLERALS